MFHCDGIQLNKLKKGVKLKSEGLIHISCPLHRQTRKKKKRNNNKQLNYCPNVFFRDTSDLVEINLGTPFVLLIGVV